MAEQLLLFTETREEKLQRTIDELRLQIDRIRKGQYAKIGQALKMCSETRHELETLKAVICK